MALFPSSINGAGYEVIWPPEEFQWEHRVLLPPVTYIYIYVGEYLHIVGTM